MKRVRTTLGELPAALRPVLEELRAADLARRPFVVVSEPLTKSFVQFGRVVCHAPPVAPGIAPVGEMGFDVPAATPSIYLQGFGNDPEIGAHLATDMLRSWFSDSATELVITLDGDPEN